MGTVYFNRLSNGYQIYKVHLNLIDQSTYEMTTGFKPFTVLSNLSHKLFFSTNIMQSKFNLLQMEEVESQGKRPSHLVLAK